MSNTSATAYAIAAMAFFATGHWVFGILCVIGALGNT